MTRTVVGIASIKPEDHAKDKRQLLFMNAKSLLTNHPPSDQHNMNAVTTDSMTQCFRTLQSIPCAGIIMGLLAGVLVSIASFIVKLLPHVNPIQIVVFR
jgi:hypothetical protein